MRPSNDTASVRDRGTSRLGDIPNCLVGCESFSFVHHIDAAPRCQFWHQAQTHWQKVMLTANSVATGIGAPECSHVVIAWIDRVVQ